MAKKIEKLPFKEFLKSFNKVPRIGISLLVKDKQKRVLLTKRANPPFEGYWHLPGSFLLKGEEIEDCIKRIENDELGFGTDEDGDLVVIYNNINGDPRGHVVELIYGKKIKRIPALNPLGDTKEINFFKKLPPKIGFGHRGILKNLDYF